MSWASELKKSSVVVTTHYHAPTPVVQLENFLKRRVKRLVFIIHPFPFAKDLRPHYRIWKNGNLVEEKFAPVVKLPTLFWYLKDFFLTVFWLAKLGRFDLSIGISGFDTLPGLIFKKFDRVKKVVLYTIDYVPKRFGNSFLNSIYHFIDRTSVQNSDGVWNLSPAMVWEREKRGIDKGFRQKQITVPIGTDITPHRSLSKFHHFQIAYTGHLTRRQGVQLVIQAMPEILRKIPKAKFVVIGSGEYLNELKKLTRSLNLEKKIKFTGFLPDDYQVYKILTNSAVAVAPYEDSPDNFVRYTDPGKVKTYLSAGLPVVITKVPHIAFELEESKCGLAIKFDKDEFVEAVRKLLINPEVLAVYRKNAREFAKKFEWNKVYGQAFQNLYG